MTKRRFFPIKYKLVALLALLVVVSISFYLGIAVDLFKKDKAAYIYETSFATVESIAHQTNDYFKNRYEKLLTLNSVIGSVNKEVLIELFSRDQGNIEFLIYRHLKNGEKLIFDMFNKAALQELGADEKILLRMRKNYPFDFVEMRHNALYIGSAFYDQTLPHFVIALYDSKKSSHYIFRIRIEELLSIFRKNKVYETFLINAQGELYAHQDSQYLVD